MELSYWEPNNNKTKYVYCTNYVTTLALGSRLKQGLTKVWAKSEAQESHFMLPKV